MPPSSIPPPRAGSSSSPPAGRSSAPPKDRRSDPRGGERGDTAPSRRRSAAPPPTFGLSFGEQAVENMRWGILGQLRRTWVAVVLPLMAVFLVHLFSDPSAGAGSIAILVIGVAASLGAWFLPRAHYRVGAALLMASVVITGIVAAFVYGAVPGVVMFFVFATVNAVVYFGPRAAVVAWLAVVLMACVPLAEALLDGSSDVHAGLLVLPIRAWIRTTVASAAILALILATYAAVVRHLGRALTELRASADRELAALRGREQAESALTAAQKLEVLGELAGGVAHDTNNALAVVLAGMRALRTESSASEREAILGDVERALEGATQTIRQVLAFSGRQAHQPKSHRVARIVREFASVARRVVPATIELSVEALGVSRCDVDRGLLEQALLNLVINARDAMPSGGALRLRCADVEGGVTISVEDSGPGVPAALRDRIFEPFFSTKARDGHGTGLGLAMVRSFVETSGGRVEVKDGTPSGACFVLFLPRGEQDPAMESSDVIPVLRMGRRVLLVEDRDDLRRALRRALVRAGMTVVEASTSAEALAALEREEALDAIVTDAILPGPPVTRVLDTAAERFPSATILVMSGYVEDELLRMGIAANRYRFLAKPFAPEVLVALIESAP